MAPYEALYGRKCGTPICWDEVGERKMLGPEIIQDTEEKIRIIRERLQTAQSRQSSYANAGRRNIQFDIGQFAYLKVSPMKGVKRFGMGKKLSPRFIGPFPIIKQVGEVAYKLELPESLSGIHNVFHVSMLRKCLQKPSEHIDIQLPN
jgi:hypothetical protein